MQMTSVRLWNLATIALYSLMVPLDSEQHAEPWDNGFAMVEHEHLAAQSASLVERDGHQIAAVLQLATLKAKLSRL